MGKWKTTNEVEQKNLLHYSLTQFNRKFYCAHGVTTVSHRLVTPESQFEKRDKHMQERIKSLNHQNDMHISTYSFPLFFVSISSFKVGIVELRCH